MLSQVLSLGIGETRVEKGPRREGAIKLRVLASHMYAKRIATLQSRVKLFLSYVV